MEEIKVNNKYQQLFRQNISLKSVKSELKAYSGNNHNDYLDISFKGMPSITDKSKDFLLKMRGFFKDPLVGLLELADKNAAVFNAVIGAFIAVFLRPIAIMAVPGAKQEDKEYAAVKSAVSSVISTAFFFSIYVPLANAIDKLGEQARNNPQLKKFPFKKGTSPFNMFNFSVNKGSGFIIAPISGFLMLKATQKVIDKFFSGNNKSKPLTQDYFPELNNREKQIYQKFLIYSGRSKDVR